MRINISSPMIGSSERSYVADCLATEMLSWRGRYVEEFEKLLATVHRTAYALTCTSGTTGLHLALMALGVRPGDEVIVPSFTYIATANAVKYCGAVPVFVDVDPDTWCLRADQVLGALTTKTVGVIPVHVYGNLCDIRAIREVLPPKAFILEDAAQAHGVMGFCQYSDAAVFSFFANKIVTCGEGGAVLTNNARLREQMFHLRGQCVDPTRSYWHTGIGFNYRMTNLQAAIGLGQLEAIADHQSRRSRVWEGYHSLLGDSVQWQRDEPGRAHWMMSVVFKHATQKGNVERNLRCADIETRPMFPPLHVQAPYRSDVRLPVSEDLFDRGLSLPTHAWLSESNVQEICDIVRKSL